MPNTTAVISLSDLAAQSSVTIAPERGAIVTSFVVGNRELLYMDESTLVDTTKNVRGGIPVLFPSPGKLRDDAWQYGGKSGAMKQHGFARTQSWSIADQSVSQVTLELVANDATLAHYPWRFHVALHFELRDACLRITVQVRNDDRTVMPYALGFHPYFRVIDKAKASIATQATKAFNNVSQRTEPFSRFDLTQAEVDLHLLDHGLIDHDRNECTLHVDDAEITVRASDDFFLWVVWTLAGKEFVCVEPWTAMGNALNTGERLISLAPGESHESWVEIGLQPEKNG